MFFVPKTTIVGNCTGPLSYFFYIISSEKSVFEDTDGDREREPLKFDDIVDRRYYDKMRPPKPGGNTCLNL